MARMQSRVAAIIYGFACKISHETGEYRASVERMAKYFSLSPKAVRSAHAELVETEWFEILERGNYSPTIYAPIREHKEWAEQHPGQCCNRVHEPWTTQVDPIARYIHAKTGETVKPKPYHIRALRSLMVRSYDSEEQVMSAFDAFCTHCNGEPENLMVAFIRHYRLTKIAEEKARKEERQSRTRGRNCSPTVCDSGLQVLRSQ